jgi:hypothetical protein
MTAPAFLASTFSYTSVTGLTDCANILTPIGSALVAIGWSSEGSEVYKSPVDADGRFFKITQAAPAAGKYELTVTDDTTTTVGIRRAQINTTAGASNTVHIFAGSHHIHIDFQTGVQSGEEVGGGLLDLSPESQVAHAKYTYGEGTRNNADSAAQNTIGYVSMIDNATSANTRRVVDYATSSNAGAACFTVNGNPIFRPKEVFSSTATVTLAFCGRFYQTILVPAQLFTIYSRIKAPVDGSTLGTFIAVSNALDLGNSMWRQAVRSA